MLAGNVVALLSPLIFVPILTYAFGPQNYDYKSMALIRLGDDASIASVEHVDLEAIPNHVAGLSPEESAKEQAKLSRASVIAKTLTGVMTLAFLILWPMPMYGTGYVFSKPFFTGWVSIGILWLFFSAACVGIYPLWEGRHSM
jgi:O-antigen/teichoic acid export membrane protein